MLKTTNNTRKGVVEDFASHAKCDEDAKDQVKPHRILVQETHSARTDEKEDHEKYRLSAEKRGYRQQRSERCKRCGIEGGKRTQPARKKQRDGRCSANCENDIQFLALFEKRGVVCIEKSGGEPREKRIARSVRVPWIPGTFHLPGHCEVGALIERIDLVVGLLSNSKANDAKGYAK